MSPPRPARSTVSPRSHHPEALLAPNISGETVFHVAAFNGHLDQVPAALLTAENLLTKTANHDTCLHAAAIAGHLNQIRPPC